MESTVLVVDWKEEPLSPIFADELSLAPSDDAPLYWTNLEQCDDHPLKTTYSEIVIENETITEDTLNIGIDYELLDNLDQLEDLSEWIKEESSFPWYEEQMGYDPVEPAKIGPNTQTLIQEFQTILEAVDPGALTPPQSPPYEQQPTLITLEPVSGIGQHQLHPYLLQLKEQPKYRIAGKQIVPDIQDYSVPGTPQTLAQELAVVDELVRSRAKDILCEPPSPSSSNSGSHFDDSSSSFSDDAEWIPEPIGELEEESTGQKPRRRYKPYHRISPEDKKSRKKEQNKNAATRYRMKKKAEVEEILNEEKSVQKESDELNTKISDLQREIRYLKGLMRDLFKAKGLIE